MKFFYFLRKSDGPSHALAMGRLLIQEREGGVVTVYDIIRIAYSHVKWCIDFEISLNKL